MNTRVALVIAVATVVLAVTAFALLGKGPEVLPPSGPPAAPATLVVLTTPTGATVTLDGFAYGVSPVEISPVVPGEHTLVLTLPGLPAVKQIVKPGPGEKLPLTINLGAADRP